jgi:drug/metabolite transporter (DMT)-like permease
MQSLWMLVASFVFAIMGVCVKLASAYYTTAEIVLCRGLVGMLFILVLITLRGGTLKHRWPGTIYGAARSACARCGCGSPRLRCCRWRRR